MKRNPFGLISAILTESWHVHQSSAETLMPMIFQLLQGDFSSKFDEIEAKEGLSPDAERLLQYYQAFDPVPYISESDTWYYENFPVKIGSIVVIPIKGLMTQEDFWGQAGTKTIISWYEKAKLDPSVKAIIELKNTQGGQVFGTRVLADYKAKYPKQIVGLCEGMECSAGLYVGSTDNYKFAISPECIIGSCGVMTTFQNWSGWYKKNGIEILDVYSKESPLKNDAKRRAMKGDFKGYTDGILFEFDASFMDFMSLHRPEISSEALKGADYTTEKAIANGLIDAIGDFDAAYDKAIELSSTTKIFKTKSNQMSKTVKMEVPAAFAAGFKLVGCKEIVEEAETPVATAAEVPPTQTITPIAETTPVAASAPVAPTNVASPAMTLEELNAAYALSQQELVQTKQANVTLAGSFAALQAIAASANPAVARSVARQEGADAPVAEITKPVDGVMEGEDAFKARYRVK